MVSVASYSNSQKAFLENYELITIFTTPRPFIDKFDLIQRNAVSSWINIDPNVEVILLGDDKGTAQCAADFRVKHIPEVECNEHGTPLVNSLFELAQSNASNQVLAYVNADIILTGEFIKAVLSINKPNFLMVGLSWGINTDTYLDFKNDNAWKEIYKSHSLESNLRQGMDYFAFTKGTWPSIPPFAIGRGCWDEWLIYGALINGVPTVDATEVSTAFHQDHGWDTIPGGSDWIWDGPEIKRNRELAGEIATSYSIGDSTWILSDRGLTRRLNRQIISRGLHRLGSRQPSLKPVTNSIATIMHPKSIIQNIRSTQRQQDDTHYKQ